MVDLNSQTQELAFLAIKEHGIREVGDQNMSQKPRAYDTFWNNLRRWRSDGYRWSIVFYALTLAAGVLGTDMTDNLETGGNDIKLL